MTSTYSLSADVRSVLAETSLSDPGEIADKVAGSIPSRALRDTLRLTLRSYVREIIRTERTSTTGSSQIPHDTQVTPAAAGSSWKRDGIRDGWRRHLDDRYSAAGTWMRLAEMTHEHLVAASSERAEVAAQNEAKADQLASWAALVKSHKVPTFGDLPASVQASVLS